VALAVALVLVALVVVLAAVALVLVVRLLNFLAESNLAVFLTGAVPVF
jgi:hypothetical protein